MEEAISTRKGSGVDAASASGTDEKGAEVGANANKKCIPTSSWQPHGVGSQHGAQKCRTFHLPAIKKDPLLPQQVSSVAASETDARRRCLRASATRQHWISLPLPAT